MDNLIPCFYSCVNASSRDEQIRDLALFDVVDGFFVRHDREVVLITLQNLVPDSQTSSVRWSIRLHF